MLRQIWVKSAPWLAGVGLAGGQAGLATRCTVPQQGFCSGCASCAVVVASLVTWALIAKKRRGGDFYNEGEEREPPSQSLGAACGDLAREGRPEER